ncbi:conserved hypothetical protein [Flavobacterium sp. 9AF]|uniref:hypothetical protein n=1 Tax=Flavobacterium sp. 9AF TaxID=2653142 RepID=UPI0012F2DE13|nr:hypothetical protein [Flavobacterium sp. 9AF]VXB36580.1 conserved hypothetical protein [Flavobacterium sp. 9AF]
MKNKKTVYLLLALVIAIWGMIVYQFLGYTNTTIEELPNKDISLIPKLDYITLDTTNIKTDYRDPFTGKLNTKKVEKKESISISFQPSTITNTKQESEITINYKGIVSDLTEKSKVFMVIINGGTYLMKIGEKEEDVNLIKGNRESITVKHKGKLKTIHIVE